MGNFLRVLLAVCCIAFSFDVRANDDGDDGSKPKKYDELSVTANRTLIKLNDFAENPSLDDVNGLRQFNHPDVIETVIKRLNLELKSSRNNVSLVRALWLVVLKYAQYSDFDKDYLLDNRDILQFIRNQTKTQYGSEPSLGILMSIVDQVHKDVEGHFQKRIEQEKEGAETQAKQRLRLRQDPGQMLAVVESFNPKFVPPVQVLEKFKNYLEAHLIGQPEIKEALYDLEFETLVKGAGNTKEPPFFFLMGLPGNGKDTAVETYIDALWGRRGASSEHMFRVKVQRSRADAWSLLGSAKGYVGSETLPDFVHFLVKHSGGKYLITKKPSSGREYEVVEAHPEWKPGQVLTGYFPPERAAVYLNEFHDWSSEAKALVLKEFLEKGIIRISGSGGGLTELVIPGIRIFAATNEGIGLLTNRDSDGIRYGTPLEYAQMMSRHRVAAPNKDLLKQELARTALRNSSGTPNDEKLGTPEEIRNRTHTSRMILLEPLSPEQIREIIRLNIEYLNEQFFDAEHGVYGGFEIAATDELVRFIQEYEYVAEENARPTKDKVRALLEYPFYQALKDGNFTPQQLKDGITLDIIRNEDKTYSLILKNGLENNGEVLRVQAIRYTKKETAKEPITDERIEGLLDLEVRLNQRVFGQKSAVRLVADAALLSEEIRFAHREGWNEQEKATSFAFLGPSSTGKSELAKALVNELYPEYGEERRIDIDFNKIQTEEDLREYIWGRRMGRDVYASEFMRKYDQYNGDILFVFEESTNTPKRLLRSLYDLFRENHPKFADGKDRPMTRVTIIMTGNAGIEWYSQIPKNVPLNVQMAAWRKVYERAMKNPEFQRATLENYMPEPLVNRIGQTNIVWFSPLDFQALHELTILKLGLFLDRLKPSNGRRGWSVGFRNEKEAMEIVEIIKREGFYLYEQGASIDRYADVQIHRGLRSLLLKHKVPSGARVVLVPRLDQTDEVILKQDHLKIDVFVENQPSPLELQVFAQKRKSVPKESRKDQILVAAHEAGHELVRQTLLGDKYRSDSITIIPGVEMIGSEWIYYAGLASSEQKEKFMMNRESAIREIAVLLGGYLGEQAVSIGIRDSSGKSNDIARATKWAEAMILKWGLEPRWGALSAESESLSEARRRLKEQLVEDILREAEVLARKAIQVNRSLHIELTNQLSTRGELKERDLSEIYRSIPIRDVSEWNASMKPRVRVTDALTHNVDLIPEVDLAEIANIQDLIEKERQEQIEKAQIPRELPILSSFSAQSVNIPRLLTHENRSENSGSCFSYFH